MPRHYAPQQAIDRTPSDTETLRDRCGTQFGPQLPDLRRVDADGSALVFAGSLRFGDALALSLQHDLPLPGRHAGQDCQHELAGRVAGVQPVTAHRQDHEADAALRQIRLDGQQFGRAARKPVRLGDGEHVTLAQEGETLGEFRPLRCARYLLAEDAFGAGRLEVAFLRPQPGRK